MNKTKNETINDNEMLLWEHALHHRRWSSAMVEQFSKKYLKSSEDEEPERLAELMLVSRTLKLIGIMYEELGFVQSEASK